MDHLTEQDAGLLEQAASMLEGLANDERNRGNCSGSEGAACSAHAIRRLAPALLRAGAAPATVAEPAWDKTRDSLATLLLGLARRPFLDFDVACIALDAATEPGMPLAYMRGAQAAPALEAPAGPAGDEEAAFTKWFQGEQGKPYQGMWEFARAAWMARAATAAAPQAPAAPSEIDAREQVTRALGLGADGLIPFAWSYLVGQIEQLVECEAELCALKAAPAAPAVDAWLQPDDMAALQRFHETAEDDESYDIGKEAVARLCAFGCLQSHSFGRYSTTDFGDYLLDTWAGARTLPFTTAAERSDRAAQAAAKGEHDD